MAEEQFKKNTFMGITYVRDVRSYYDYIEVLSEYRMNVGVSVVIDNVNCVCIGSHLVGTLTYAHKFVPESTMRILSSVSHCASASTIEEIINLSGYKHSLKYSFGSHNYICGASGITSLLDYLNDDAIVLGGGAPCFCVTLYGNIICMDYKYEMEHQTAIELPSMVHSDVTNVEWMNEYPSRIEVVCGDDNGLSTKEIQLRKVGITSRVYAMDNTDGEFDRLENKYKNDFNRRMYRSRVVEFVDTTGLCTIGKKVKVCGIEGIVDKVALNTLQTGTEPMKCSMSCGLD